MSERQVSKELQSSIDKYLSKIELLLVDVPRHIRNDYVNELEDFLLSDYQSKYDENISEKENIKKFINSLDAPDKAVSEFLLENHLEKFNHPKVLTQINSYLKQELERKPLQTISILASLLGIFILLPVIVISNASFNTTTGDLSLGLFLFLVFIVSFLVVQFIIIKDIQPKNWVLKILSFPLMIIFTVLPLYLLENIYILFTGSTYTQLSGPTSEKGVILVKLPYSGHIFIDWNAFFILVMAIVVLLFCIFFIVATLLYFIFKRNYRKSILKKSFLIHFIGSLVVILFIISIFSPPISIDNKIAIDPSKESGAYYVAGSDISSKSYKDIEHTIWQGGEYYNSYFVLFQSSIYRLTKQNSVPMLENMYFNNLIAQPSALQWSLHYTSLDTYINQKNGSVIEMTFDQKNNSVTERYTISIDILGDLLFEYYLSNTTYITEVYSISSSNLIYVSSNQTPSIVGLQSFTYITNWYLWKIDIYTKPYKYSWYYAIFNLIAIVVAYVCILVYSKYVIKKNKL